jgi:glycerophosphoryl diester phosphodiesterase
MSAGGERRVRRVGHKGADAIIPGNTYASFDAALEVGVDMIEFDVLPEPPPDWRKISVAQAERLDHGGVPLLLAHDWGDASRRQPETLEDGLDHLASEPFTAVGLDVDLKLPGYELRVVEALRAHGLIERTLISTMYIESLDAIRAVEPGLKLGWTVPKLRRDPFRSPWTRALAYVGLAYSHVTLPSRAARAIRTGRCHALMAHWRLVTPRLVRAVTSAGGELYVWTVDELPRLQALEALGVTGLITNDPRLFAAIGA